MQYCLSVDPNCTIVYGGDACDRGEDGYTIMADLLANNHVIYLKGNHEDLFVESAKVCNEVIMNESVDRTKINSFLADSIIQIADYTDEIVWQHLHNGGEPTLKQWLMHGANMHFINQIDKLPLTYSYNNYDFGHAGGVYQTFLNVAGSELTGQEVEHYSMNHMLWSRAAFNIGWAPGRIYVHGHTPVVYLPKKYLPWDTDEEMNLSELHPVLYRGTFDKNMSGFKVDMDMCTIVTGMAYLLNCSTQELVGFYDNKIKDKKSTEDVKIIKQYYLEA